MVSSSYQSSLLRFAVNQYRRGVERHRKALCRANSTVRLSAELGTAVIVLPIYMAARASVAAGRRLSNAFTGRSLPAASAQARKLLDFSGFGSVADEDAHSSLPNKTAVQTMPASARPIFRMLVAVGRCLSTSQLATLSNLSELAEDRVLSSTEVMSDEGRPSKSWLVRWVAKSRVAARQLLNLEEVALTVSGGLVTAGHRQITGLASDIETRSLRLVLNYRTVWNGLSFAQQQRLSYEIARVMGGDALASTGAIGYKDIGYWIAMGKAQIRRLGAFRRNSQKLLPASEQPIELKWPQSRNVPAIAQLFNLEDRSLDVCSDRFDGASSLALSPAAGIASTSVATSKAIAINDNTHINTSSNINSVIDNGRSDNRDSEEIEAAVISSIYVEHPLEKVLKWVDRVLLWIENQWQVLKRRLISQIEAIFH